MVLHDWSDQEASRLLASIKAAAPAGARVVAFELVVPDGGGPHLAKMIDLTMLGMLNGRERTRAEYRLLLEQAGFEFEAVTATPTPVSVITARTVSPGRPPVHGGIEEPSRARQRRCA